jgi:hypothetical protein
MVACLSTSVATVPLCGRGLLLAGARRASRRGRAVRHGLKQSHRDLRQSRRETDTVGKDRDDLIDQRDTAHAQTASARENDSPPDERQPTPADRHRHRLHLFGH